MSDTGDLEQARPTPLDRRPLEPGRVGTYAALGVAAGVLPLPWVPEALLERVRGALVQDLTARHGIALTPEARAVLAAPSGPETPTSWLAVGARFAAVKVLGRLGPLAVLPPVRAAGGTYLLGHLFARYLETARTSRSSRIEVDEARRVRRAIDQAVLYALTTDVGPAPRAPGAALEDFREAPTKLIDGVIQAIASVPGSVLRRVDAAFDENLASVRA